METVDNRVQDLVEKLRSQDCRITPQRLAILRTLASSRIHPSVEQIFDAVKIDFPTTSIATVYKTVSLLKEMGELIEFSFGDGSNHYDGRNPSPHPHFICTSCRKIEDIQFADQDRLAEIISGKDDYLINAYQLNCLGLCPECRRKQESGADQQKH